MTRLALLLALIAAPAVLTACDDPKGAQRALEAQGFKDIKLTGFSPFSCGKDDGFATGFEATGPTGVRVKGAVCSAWLKGSTVRTW